MHSCNRVEHYRKVTYCLTLTKRDFTSLKLEYIGYCSLTKDGRLSPAQITDKVNCKLHSQYLYVTRGWEKVNRGSKQKKRGNEEKKTTLKCTQTGKVLMLSLIYLLGNYA